MYIWWYNNIYFQTTLTTSVVFNLRLRFVIVALALALALGRGSSSYPLLVSFYVYAFKFSCLKLQFSHVILSHISRKRYWINILGNHGCFYEHLRLVTHASHLFVIFLLLSLDGHMNLVAFWGRRNEIIYQINPSTLQISKILCAWLHIHTWNSLNNFLVTSHRF